MGKGKASSSATKVEDTKKSDRMVKSLLKKKRSKDRTYETSEEINFAKALADDGFFVRHMDSDGNCMFRSIADQLTGNANNHDQYRQLILNYMETNKDHFSLFIEDSENFTEYVHRMRQDGEWGDQPELCAAVQCLHVNIFVHQVDAPTYVIPSSSSDSRDIHVSFHGGCHYNSVRALDDDQYDSPARHLSSSLSINPSVADRPKSDDSDTLALKTVKLAVPWAKTKDIQVALRMAEGDADAAIEILMSNPEGLSDAPEEPIDVPDVSNLKIDRVGLASTPTVNTHTATESKRTEIGESIQSAPNCSPDDRTQKSESDPVVGGGAPAVTVDKQSTGSSLKKTKSKTVAKISVGVLKAMSKKEKRRANKEPVPTSSPSSTPSMPPIRSTDTDGLKKGQIVL